MFEISYLDSVEEDITAAKQWYAEQQKGLDERFAAAVKETVESIMEMPLVYAVRYKNVRIAHTKIFPYHVHFYFDREKGRVVIIGVVHNKRHDALFLDR